MTLPPLPEQDPGDTGWDWMEKLSNGWHVVPLWASEGYDLGRWPLVVFAHYDEGPFGLATRVEGDIEVKEFPTQEERDRATSELAVWYWNHYETPGAPKHMRDARLGPCII